MEQELKINVEELIGAEDAISSDDGQKLYKKLDELLKAEKKAVVDFKNIDLIVSSFLNSAFGRLVKDFDKKTIEKLIRVDNLSKEDKDLLDRVLDMAKLYFDQRPDIEDDH